MKKLFTAFFVLFSFSLSAQTLFYYGNDSVSVKDFLRAYNKNNGGAKSEKAFREYLDLYIASRLKIKEARLRGYDTLPQLVSDHENLRLQILPSYLNDKETVDKLVQEAFSRSQKDIHIAHIFVGNNPGGGEEAEKKINAAFSELKSGKEFGKVALTYSEDPSVKNNAGDAGWITVFSLPYELENLAYSTPVGKFSAVHQSRGGYHIFKNLGERKDPGKIRAAQILLAFPDKSDATMARVKKLADSLYARLQKGDDFGDLATAFSNDVVSAASRGQMQDFGSGQYEPEFERHVFALATNGAITKPFLTSHGYHIVKRISRTPVATSLNDAMVRDALKSRVEQSDRMASMKAVLAGKILKQGNYKKLISDPSPLYLYTDSVLNYKRTGKPIAIATSTPLFKINDKVFTVTDWMAYAQSFRFKPDGSGLKSYSVLWDDFMQAMLIDHYQNHLEDFNEEFRNQLMEFKEGNLFFEIMQREVWTPAQNDSVAIAGYYDRNRSKYNWKPSVDAVIFYAADEESAKAFRSELQKSTTAWNSILNNFSERIASDSSRFELEQIPNPAKKELKPGTITELLVNKTDNTASFAWIIRNHNNQEPRSLADARGLVINDYQVELEKKWIDELRKKYPVRINEKAVATLVKK